ncbi:MAG: 1-acyl-sn-glycerol-3-phosphate acyltransferase [Chitinophagaceae bacterium]|nr:1-acyl-sn-glycerol-3-phosphate acyltransferase [Chitinophagaceae bacterium]
MQMLKNIFARIWAFYALVLFFVTMCIIVIPILLTYLVKEPFGTEMFRRISKLWMQCWLTLAGCPLIVKGKKNFKKGETYIVTCNHNSYIDIPVTTPFIPGANKTIATKAFRLVPIFGWIYVRGSILVDRNSDASRRRSYDQMKKTLVLGLHMCIYPEGTRNRTNKPLKSFYDGAFKLSIDTNKSIVPAIIFNARKILPPNRIFYMMPHRLELHFLEPVDPANKTTKELKTEVFNMMESYILANTAL